MTVGSAQVVEQQMQEQERLLQGLLEAHRRTMQGLGVGDFDIAAASHSISGAPSTQRASQHLGNKITSAPSASVGAHKAEYHDKEETDATKGELAQQLETLGKCDELREWWKRTSGLHTVENWLTNYRKHPAGWAALLMIHGIPEVTGRLRSKVENYAIYSALFLSMSIALLTDPPGFVSSECPQGFVDASACLCHVRKRIYLYCFAIGTATHMLSIVLAMSFVNALNEAARDSDVFRMFARGEGFIATVKCQNAFKVGCGLDMIAVVTAVSYQIGWEAVCGAVLLGAVGVWRSKETSSLLFRSSGIVGYWREDLGGQPDNDDPYVLRVPLGVLKENAKLNNQFFRLLGAEDVSDETTALFSKMPDHDAGVRRGVVPLGHGNNLKKGAVAALF